MTVPVALLALAVAAGAVAAAGQGADDGGSYRVVEQVIDVPEEPGGDTDIGLDTSLFLPDDTEGRVPAILVAHGFAGSKENSRKEAAALAEAGYAVLTWTARGFGASGGEIGLNDPDYEVADVSRLLDWLAQRPEIQLDGEGDPHVGMTGGSYGGAVTLLAAGTDDRIDAIAPRSTYSDLADALFPDASGNGPRNGVFKQMWAGLLFTAGSVGTQDPGGLGGAGGLAAPGGARAPASDSAPPPQGASTGEAEPGATGSARCGRFRPEVCDLYVAAAEEGRPSQKMLDLLHRNSPASVVDDIAAPTLLVQGMQDSLFPLDQADATARALENNGVPLDVMWTEGGHDAAEPATQDEAEAIRNWFDAWLKGDGAADAATGFSVTREQHVSNGGRSTRQGTIPRAARTEAYPGLDGTDAASVPLSSGTGGGDGGQRIVAPPGGSPAALSSIPALGALSGLSGGLPGGAGFALDIPGQTATFTSAPLDSDLTVTGAPTITIRVADGGDTAPADTKDDQGDDRDGTPTEAVLFAKVYDVSPDGTARLPRQLVAPVRVPLTADGTDVEIRLPAVDHTFAEGHTLRFAVSTTDLAYDRPRTAATYGIDLPDPQAGLTLPTQPDLVTPHPLLPVWTWALPLSAVIVAAGLLLIGRRKAGPAPVDPDLADVPLRIEGLTKRFPNGYLAVDHLSLRVERGQVLGLLGPNGAGKTTTLRMLMGLVRPDAGDIRVFGHQVVPGTPALARLGSFVEGPGHLPHLSGRANLELYWRATGRPLAEANMDEAVRIAALGAALERPVRTYSQGMRQRLSIAQAMLGLPDLLVLDEPTNGLDPPQIREMRDVLVAYAATGRTVIISSHLLAEVEQTCTHAVVMDRGRHVAAGPVTDIVGEGDAVLVGVPDPAAVADRVRAMDGVAEAEPAEGGLVVRLREGTVAGLVAALVAADIPVQRVVPRRRLEDAFLSLISSTERRADE
ncbi:CocE/NonD family hydrolase [Nocardiopsis rhodophaea]|uniref:CocE/NonD family hydrolase n=1 Tax=Nocardiopsis rhodophaea TaxID=280238 RepID=UPI0031D5B0D0